MENARLGMTGLGEGDSQHNTSLDLSSSVVKRAGILPDESFRGAPERRRPERHPRRLLRVMKFGGTSVGDASCIRQAVEIIRAASRDSSIVVVVSAMSGVTNRLVEAAGLAESGDREGVARIFEGLLNHHNAAASALIRSTSQRAAVIRGMREVLAEGNHLCQGTILLRESTPRARDAIAGLGERLSVRLLAAALADRGVVCEAIEATEVVVTDPNHGASDALMDLTTERCEARLRPLLHRGVLPVVTGYIGATQQGVLTTLGRNGSDYSATILGAALHADEVIIWTDVDGVLTADPRLVSAARTIPEISYREATELAYFGAKVLHPKTLRPVMQLDIPVWICNTFRPEQPGTKITRTGSANGGGVKALTAAADVGLITVAGPGIVGARDVLGRTFMTTGSVRADVLLVSRCSSQNDISFVVPSAIAKRTVEALRQEFAYDLANHSAEHIVLDQGVAVVSVIGERMRGTPGVVRRTVTALGQKDVNIISIAQGFSECNVSFVLARKDIGSALVTIHHEFQLHAPKSQGLVAD